MVLWRETKRTGNIFLKKLMIQKIASNLINQNFTVNEPDTVYLSDITYIETGGKYLFVIHENNTGELINRDTKKRVGPILDNVKCPVFSKDDKLLFLVHDNASQLISTEAGKTNLLSSGQASDHKSDLENTFSPDSKYLFVKQNCSFMTWVGNAKTYRRRNWKNN